jgi:hypothetical protein
VLSWASTAVEDSAASIRADALRNTRFFMKDS